LRDRIERGSTARNQGWPGPTTRGGVKKSEIEHELRDCGWWLARQGHRHEVWTNGKVTEAVPRHKEIDEYTARSILKKARAQRVKP
jgi:mRNA interferase HicA